MSKTWRNTVVAIGIAFVLTSLARAEEGSGPVIVRNGTQPGSDDRRNLMFWSARTRVAPGPAANGVRPSWKRPPDALAHLLQTIADNTQVTERSVENPQVLPKALRRATRRAVGRILRETTSVGELLHDNDDDNTLEDGNRSLSSSGSVDDRVRFRFGVSHLAPKVEMRCPTSGGALGVSLSALGHLSVDLRPAGTPGARLHASYDRSARKLDVLFRLSY